MSSSIQRFIETQLQVAGVQDRRRQMRTQEEATQAEIMSTFQRLFQTMSPEGRQQFLNQYSGQTGRDVSQMRAAADATIMNTETQRAQLMQRTLSDHDVAREAGLMATIGQDSATFARNQALANFYQTRGGALGETAYQSAIANAATGQTLAQLALGADIASRNPAELRRINDYQYNLRMTPEEQAQIGIAQQNAATSAFSANTARMSTEQSYVLGTRAADLNRDQFNATIAERQALLRAQAARALRTPAGSTGDPETDAKNAEELRRLIELQTSGKGNKFEQEALRQLINRRLQSMQIQQIPRVGYWSGGQQFGGVR